MADTSETLSPSLLEKLNKNNKQNAASLMHNAKSASTLSQQMSTTESSKTSTSTTTTSRIAKTSSSQRTHHVTSSSSTSTISSAEVKATSAASAARKFANMKGSIDIGKARAGIPELKMPDGVDGLDELKKKLKSSFENLVDDVVDVDDCPEPTITFPSDGNTPENELNLALSPESIAISSSGGIDTVKIEQKRMTSASSKKVVTDSFSTEEATSNVANFKQIQANDLEYKEEMAASAVKNTLEIDGMKAEKNSALLQEQRSLKAGEFQAQDSNNIAAASVKLSSDGFSAEKRSISQAQARKTVTAGKIFNKEEHTSSSSQSKITYSGTSMITSSSQMSTHSLVNGNIKDEEFIDTFRDLEQVSGVTSQKDVERAISKYTNTLESYIKSSNKESPTTLDHINDVMRRAWVVPQWGHELGLSLCNTLRSSGGLDLVLKNCSENDKELQFSSARLLEQTLTTENRSHVVENGLRQVVKVACGCTKDTRADRARVGTGILEHLFKHSEGTCSDVIKMGGLETLVSECRKNDVEILRHCSSALANLSLYGGAENHESMIKQKVQLWLFPLAFHEDNIIKYYALLTIAVLLANKEIEAEVIKSGTLELIDPFIDKWKHRPADFAKNSANHAHGQSKQWLQRLLPVLGSNREEACNLAAFHFCMEAAIKKEQGNTEIFKDINAIEPLKKVASCPNATASRLAAQALRLIGEEVPHKLSQQVPLWTPEDVREWVKQIGFNCYEEKFFDSKVDGDLLLQLTDDNLQQDLGMTNGIWRKRFERELQNLKKMADYSSKDTSSIHSFLASIGPEFIQYTYAMINAGVDQNSLKHLNEDQLEYECGIKNSIHRARIINSLKSLETKLSMTPEDVESKCLDVFVSYRRSNGSQLASLLKVHLQLRGFSVFIDVERLEAGKFDSNLLQSIKQAKHFLLVLTPSALERCLDDYECKDWVHREIVAALNSSCNIVPIIDNFTWPEAEQLPDDMRSICNFNGIRWIHDYQDACVDKLERFLRGEMSSRSDIHRNALGRGDATPNTPGTAGTNRIHPPSYQRMGSTDSRGSDKENFSKSSQD
ncbi:NAD(+) hydrolase sarm1 isoform X3 [Culicoides brevitarsis]